MSQYYQLFVNKLDGYVNDPKQPLTTYFEKAEKLTNVKRSYLAQGILGFLSLYLVIGRAAQFVCNLIGFVYPAYKSLLALESTNKDDDSKWLTYWVVFAAFSVVEFFSDILLSWFPLYWLAKVAFMAWCAADIPLNGSLLIYNRIIRPLFLKNKSKIESTLNGSPSASSNTKNN